MNMRIALLNAAAPVVQPLQDVGHARYLMPRGQPGPRHHQHGQGQCASRLQLGLRAGAASVLAHDDIDPVLAQQCGVARHVERAARDDDGVVRQQWQHLGFIDQPQDVVVLWLHREEGQVHAAQCQHHALRRTVERGGGGWQIGHGLPAVIKAGSPGIACQRQQRNAGLCARRDGVAAHGRRKGMRGIHQVGHAFVAQMAHQAGHAAKAAHAHSNGLRLGLGDAARIRQHGALATFGQGQRQRAGFGGAAQDQDIAHG